MNIPNLLTVLRVLLIPVFVLLFYLPFSWSHLAASAVFVAETAALNGCTLPVDNGQHLVPLGRDVMFAIETTRHGAEAQEPPL